MNDVAAMPTAPNANPMSNAAGNARIDPRRGRQPEGEHHADEADRVQAAADERPDELAEGDVARRERRRQDRREGLVVVELEEEVERALVDRAVHRRAREQRRCDERLVGDRLAAGARDRADQRADPEADPEQVEERLEEARQITSQACR